MNLVWPGPDDLGFFIKQNDETVLIDIGDDVIITFNVLDTCTIDEFYVHNDPKKPSKIRTFRLTHQIIHAIYIGIIRIDIKTNRIMHD